MTVPVVNAYINFSTGPAFAQAIILDTGILDVNLNVSAPSGDAFAQLIAQSIQVAGRSGYSTAPNGGLP